MIVTSASGPQIWLNPDHIYKVTLRHEGGCSIWINRNGSPEQLPVKEAFNEIVCLIEQIEYKPVEPQPRPERPKPEPNPDDMLYVDSIKDTDESLD